VDIYSVPVEFGDGDWLGVTKTVTVGIGVGSGFGGTSESRGSISGAARTTLTIPRDEKLAKKRTSAVWVTAPAALSTEVTSPTGTPGTKG
jgi:hypothetical protein